MRKKVVTLALIGAGQWGKNYLESCKNLPGVRIGAVVTKSGKTKIEDLLLKKDLDGFIIATPTATHFKIAKLLIENDKNVLIEKPVTASYKETRTLFEISKKHPKSRILAGHLYLYNPAYRKLKKSVRKIGKIKSLSFVGLQSPIRPNINVFWDWSPHPVYLFLDLMKTRPTVKSAKITPPDGAEITLDFNGVPAQIKIGWTYPQKVREIKVVGEKGTLNLKEVKSKDTPLQNEILHFAAVIRGEAKPLADLKQALIVAKIIEEEEIERKSN